MMSPENSGLNSIGEREAVEAEHLLGVRAQCFWCRKHEPFDFQTRERRNREPLVAHFGTDSIGQHGLDPLLDPRMLEVSEHPEYERE